MGSDQFLAIYGVRMQVDVEESDVLEARWAPARAPGQSCRRGQAGPPTAGRTMSSSGSSSGASGSTALRLLFERQR